MGGRPSLSSLVWFQTELDSTQSYYHYRLGDLYIVSQSAVKQQMNKSISLLRNCQDASAAIALYQLKV